MKSSSSSSPSTERTEGEKTLRTVAIVSVTLATIKFIAFLLSGSMLVMASFLDSLGDAVISYMNSYVHRLARESADKEHPFGHGGFEVIASLAQGLLLLLFAGSLGYESVTRMVKETDARSVALSELPIAIGILLFASLSGLLIQIFISRHKLKMEEKNERSLSIQSDLAHYAGDAFSNLTSAAGLIAVWYFKMEMLDALFGVLAAGFILKTALPIIKQSVGDITHGQASPDLQNQIRDLVKGLDPKVLGLHRLRTRELGPVLFIDFHMTLPRDLRLEEAHSIGEKVAQEIKKKIPRADVIIHLDPDSEPDDDHW